MADSEEAGGNAEYQFELLCVRLENAAKALELKKGTAAEVAQARAALTTLLQLERLHQRMAELTTSLKAAGASYE